MKEKQTSGKLAKSEVVAGMPVVCSDERAAVEFFEQRLWKGTPKCYHCQSTNVYQMRDSKTGERNKRFLWRCHDCKGQFTVRLGTVFEESRIPLRHWAYAFWRASTSKKGVSALEIQRQTLLSYKSALFLMHRIRFALTPETTANPSPMGGTVEIDETYIGGQIREQNNSGRRIGRRRNNNKIPVVSLVQRNGDVRSKVIVNVNGRNLHRFINKNVSKDATVNTDGFAGYHDVLYPFARHDVVNHSVKEYARHNADGTVSHVNTCESVFSLVKRGLMGIYHNVSREHLHRYLGEFDFRWNTRNLSDGDRTVAAIEGAAGKRLDYRTYTA